MKLLMDKTSTLGDCLCYLPAVSAAAACPDVEQIALVTTPIGWRVFSGLSDKIELVTVPHRDVLKFGAFRGIGKAWPPLKGIRFDAAVHNHHSATFNYALAWLLRVPMRSLKS